MIYPPRNYHIPLKITFEDDFPFPKVGHVSSLESMIFLQIIIYHKMTPQTVGSYDICWCIMTLP